MAHKTYSGSCHCGDVKFEADIDWSGGTGRCNCSICLKTRNWSISMKPEAFRLLTDPAALQDYQFNTNSAHHVFCKRCGVRSFGHGDIPEMGGAYYSVRVNCLDNLDPKEIKDVPISYADGRHNNWWNAPEDTWFL